MYAAEPRRADVSAGASLVIDPPECFSVADILAVLYLEIFQHKPGHPAWPGRDRFILAKISAWPLYGFLLHRLGYFSAEEAEPADMNDLPGLDFPPAPPGIGLSAAAGFATGFRMDGRGNRVFALLGRGELHSGRTWEAAARAGDEKLSRLCAVIDFCSDSRAPSREETEQCTALAEKFRIFGWESLVVDGHALDELRYAFSKFNKSAAPKPFVLIARTIRGKGSPLAEETREELGRNRHG